jgi:uncharacterized protein (DUF697 family)
MRSWVDLSIIWDILREVDISDLQEDAFRTPRLALVGAPEKAAALQERLQQGPNMAGQILTAAPIYRLPVESGDLEDLASYDLQVLMVDSPSELAVESLGELSTENAGLLTVVDSAKLDTPIAGSGDQEPGYPQAPQRYLVCSLDDPRAMEEILLPAIAARLPGQEVALARAYPALRPSASRQLILETSLANATYALGTGIGELVPVLTIPLTLADIVVLTKNQILMAYKIAMGMGESGTLREVLPTLAAVVGFGFFWRQTARQLVGLIPGFGLIPKVVVSYAGTYISGQIVYHWYATGEKLRGEDLQALYADALARGQAQAARLVARLRKQELPAGLGGAGGKVEGQEILEGQYTV